MIKAMIAGAITVLFMILSVWRGEQINSIDNITLYFVILISLEIIKYLLCHSDCDGILTPWECTIVAPRLKELIRNWNDDDYDRMTANVLIKGMNEAAENMENLEFR